MNYYPQSDANLLDTLFAPYADAFNNHFIQGNYSPKTVEGYYCYFTYFSQWLKQNTFDIDNINEGVIQRFLGERFPGDTSKQTVCQFYCCEINYENQHVRTDCTVSGWNLPLYNIALQSFKKAAQGSIFCV